MHLHVCFACNRNDAIAVLAKKHLERPFDKNNFGFQEAVWFLDDLSRRTGGNPGPKGGLSLWGIVGGSTDAKCFVQLLKPFFKDLLDGVDGGPLAFHHILIFTQTEELRAMTVYEVFLDRETKDLKVKTHEQMPFAAMQM